MRTCLIVDDSRVIRKVARRILEDMGFDAAEAADGAEALSWCRTAMPDVVLLDWNMPVMNGLEFLRRLRMEPGGEGPKVIFCTVENETPAIREALAYGADEYIMKPFDSDIVAAKFAEAGLA
ncbi:response regulator [Phenylobacterium sp.]|uniref:response regulator n=1 Tax=Phenylobacterium sp. TaxID=1871053 RepID=UPI002FD8D3CD